MSHYVSRKTAETKDMMAIRKVLDLDPRGLFDTVMRGGDHHVRLPADGRRARGGDRPGRVGGRARPLPDLGRDLRGTTIKSSDTPA